MIRLLVADDHPVVRDGVRALLANTSVHVCAEAATGARVLQIIDEKHCDAILLDLSLPDAHGLDVLRKVRERRPSLPVIVFTNSPDQARPSLEAGAKAFLRKDAPAEELLQAIETVVGGRQYIGSSVRRQSLEQRTPGRRDAPMPHLELSRRELEVMLRLAEGMRPKEIAHALGISQKTVDTYRSRLMKKIGVTDHRGLILYALKAQLTDWS